MNACRATVYGTSFGGHACRRPGKVERDGRWYCEIHDPVRVKEKAAVRNAKWDAERIERDAAWKAKAQRQAELERRFAWFPHLVAALEELEALGGLGQRAHAIIRSALATAASGLPPEANEQDQP